jgi:hypothetical protein
VLKICNDYVAEALLQLGPKYGIQYYQDTSVFIKIISTWWSIVNVNTPLKGMRHNNVFERPLLPGVTESKSFLQYFVVWVTRWGIGSEGGHLTRETYTALLHTSKTLLEIAEYCFSSFDAKYILLGKFQTDSLEARFGQYRQLAGGVYDVSIRQIFECERKLRVMSVLKLNNREIDLNDFSCQWNDFEKSVFLVILSSSHWAK